MGINMIIKILSTIAFIGSVGWFIAQPDWEPAIAIVTSLIALIVCFIYEKKQKGNPSQTQKVEKNGVGIQAGGNVEIGDINNNRKK
jgi:hypothetical protein